MNDKQIIPYHSMSCIKPLIFTPAIGVWLKRSFVTLLKFLFLTALFVVFGSSNLTPFLFTRIGLPQLAEALKIQGAYAAPFSGTINDDAHQTEIGQAAILNSTSIQFGNTTSRADYIGFRATNVTVPNGATIRHAYLKVYLTSYYTTSTYQLKGEDVDSATAFAAVTDDLSGRTLTAASTTSEIHDLLDGYRFFDVTTIVQEIVNRVGWSPGNALAFIFNSPSASYMPTFSMLESANDPELGIIYDGSADSVRSPTVSGTAFYTNPDNAFSSNNVYATATNAPTTSQVYESFNMADLTGNVIDGILVKVEAKVSNTSYRSEYTIELSWDGGVSWTTPKRGFQYQTVDRTYSYSGADAWDHAFLPSELTNANFKVRITNDFSTGTNDSSVDHITVQVFYSENSPPTASSVEQREYDGTCDGGETLVSETGAILQKSICLNATLNDPDGNTIKYEVEVKSVGTGFSNTATDSSGFVSSGSIARVTVGSLSYGTGYHWQYRAVDSIGGASAWAEFGTPGNTDFTVTNVTPTIGSLEQRVDDGSCDGNEATVPVGGDISQQGICLEANVTDGNTNPTQAIRLEIEVQPVSTSFTGTATHCAPSCSTYDTQGIKIKAVGSLIVGTSYHWQARGVDDAGLASAWVSFGGNPETDADFSVQGDCGLRFYDGTSVVTIACEPAGTLTSPLRIRKGTTTYGIILVDPTDPNASKVRINTSSGIKALKKLP